MVVKELLRYGFIFLIFLIGTRHSHAQGYNFVGDSYPIGGDCYVLTPEGNFENGAIWYNQAIDISEPFNLQYTANFGPDDAGADGMFFVLQQVGNQVLGEAGGGIGFSGFQPSLGVEFDTYQNFENGDPSYDHLSIQRNGNVNHNAADNLAGPVTISSSSVNVEDGQDYVIEINWDPAVNQFSVSVNCTQRLLLIIDLEDQVFTNSPEVFWGFTGATGGEFNEQIVCLDPYILGLPETFTSCLGEPVQLEAPPATFGTFSWEPAEFLDDPSSTSPIADVTETTEFTLTYEDLCGDLQVETTTVVVEEPSVDLGPDLNECATGEVLVEAGGNYDEIIWSDGSQEPSLTIAETGQFWATASIGGCEVSDTVNVEISPLPEFEGITEAEPCEGDTYQFELDQPGTDILWFDGDPSDERSFTESGEYDFELSLGECTQSYTLSLDFIPLPTIDLGEDIDQCGNAPIDLMANGDFEEVIWSDGSTQSSIEVNQSGPYWATVTAQGCENADTVQIQFLEAPQYTDDLEITLCEGEDYLFELNQPQTEILWFDDDDSPNRPFDQSGTYPFTLTLGDCTADFELEVEVFPIPSFELGPDFAFCQGASATLETGLTEAAVNWSEGSSGLVLEIEEGGTYWAVAEADGCSFSDTIAVSTLDAPDLELSGPEGLCPEESGVLNAESLGEVTWYTGEVGTEITIGEPGFYTAVAENGEGCTTEASIIVQAFTLPRVVLQEEAVKCLDQPLRIEAESDNGAGLIWSDGTTGSILTVEEPATYSVELTNDCGTTLREVVVTEEFCADQVFVPNAFTPDGDGLNDLFRAEVEGAVLFELWIFNRLGDEVFVTKSAKEGWNGSFGNNGYYCRAGVYTWRLEVAFSETEPEVRYGTVMLVR